LIVTSGLAYFTALAMLTPVLPLYVKGPLGGTDTMVGLAIGTLFVGAIVLRPWAGRVGDRVGRRVLVISGAAIVAGSTALYGLVESFPYLVAMRALTGVGEAAFFVGAATMVTDIVPAARRGEAISYWSVSVYGGLAFGPALGEMVHDAGGFDATWLSAAGLALVAVVLGCFTSDTGRPPAGASSGPLLHRGSIVPGTVMFSGLIALAGFTAFVALYARRIGLGGADTIFLLYGGIVLAIRVFGARLQDRLGSVRAGFMALSGIAGGMIVIASWGTVTGLYVGTVVYALGAALLYPAILLLALARASDQERASVVGTVSSFFDLSQGLGSLIVGVVVSAAGYRGGFAFGAGCALVAIVILRTATRRSRAPVSVPRPEPAL